MPFSHAPRLLLVMLMAAPCALAAQQAAAAGPAIYTAPPGTKVLLSLKSSVNTRTARPGDGVYLVSAFPVTVASRVFIPSGVYVQGVIDSVERPGVSTAARGC